MPPRLRLARALRRFLADHGGATALEFGMIAAPLIFMILATFELGMVFVVTTTLDTATLDAARTIRTGQTQAGQNGATAASFRDAICANMSWLGSQCSANLTVDVRGFQSFNESTAPSPSTGPTFDPTKLVFDTGAPGEIMLVRSFYQWNLFTPALYGGLETIPGTQVDVVTSATTFRNEPF